MGNKTIATSSNITKASSSDATNKSNILKKPFVIAGSSTATYVDKPRKK